MEWGTREWEKGGWRERKEGRERSRGDEGKGENERKEGKDEKLRERAGGDFEKEEKGRQMKGGERVRKSDRTGKKQVRVGGTKGEG